MPLRRDAHAALRALARGTPSSAGLAERLAPDLNAGAAMTLTRLEVSDFRNIESASLKPDAGLNLVVGRNASGKSSLLESVHLLCTGYSFRSRHAAEYIRRGAQKATVHGVVVGAEAEGVAVGVEKRPRGTRLRWAGSPLRSASALAWRLPLVMVPPDSQRLVFDGADLRRRLLDWGVFHVEHDYAATYQGYRRALQQRNALLRNKPEPAALAPWNLELDELGGRLHALRSLHLKRMLPRVAELASKLASLVVSIHYYAGWDTRADLAEALAANVARDIARGHTGVGPHRADLVLKVGDRPAAQVLSRGEAKLACLALWIAQAREHQANRGQIPLILIDDLAAELDAQSRGRIFQALAELRAQSFITSVSDALVNDLDAPFKGFHVERGKVAEMV